MFGTNPEKDFNKTFGIENPADQTDGREEDSLTELGIGDTDGMELETLYESLEEAGGLADSISAEELEEIEEDVERLSTPDDLEKALMQEGLAVFCAKYS